MKTNNFNLSNLKNTNIMKFSKFIGLPIIALALFTSCESDDDGGVVEDEEAITQVRLTFTNQTDANDTVVLNWTDANLDEVVDEDEKIITGEFNISAIYDAEIELFNEDEDFLEEDITADQAGIDAHFFVYEASDVDFTMARSDDDFTRSDNNKLGVLTTWTAGDVEQDGTINIKLYHESPSVSDMGGFGTAEGTDTDLDITFNVEIDD